MIRYFQHKEIDKRKWDATIAAGGNVYAYSWYLDVVHPSWDALVEDDYVAVMPITGGKKFGVNYLYQPFFIQQLGVFSRTPLAPEKTEEFLRNIPSKYRFTEIRLNESNTLNNTIENIDYHRNIILNLNQNYNAIRDHYHTNTKRNLAKAESHDLVLFDTVAPDQVVALFRNNRGALLDKWGDIEYDRLIALTNEAVGHGAAFVRGVTRNDELLCAAIFMFANGRVTFLFSGLNQEGKDKQAMTFLLDQVIKKYAGQPLVFDFEGSDDENLARFYLGFGGQEVHYPEYSYNHLSSVGKALLKVWKKRE